MDRIFKFLQDDEHRHLIALAQFRTYQANKRLFGVGDERTDIFMLIKGEVRLEHRRAGRVIEVARCGPGETIGQTFFLEGRASTLNYVAVNEVSALVIANADVRRQIVRNPGFGGRFYHSLAALISRSLRETSSLVTATQTMQPAP